MFLAMVVVFVLGYIAIALEHPLRVDKAVPALMIGTILWVLYIFGAFEIFTSGLSVAWNEFLHENPGHDDHGINAMRHFIIDKEIIHPQGEETMALGKAIPDCGIHQHEVIVTLLKLTNGCFKCIMITVLIIVGNFQASAQS